ncbi:hypothetical protein [Leptospira santarosai]|uniref:hypothetical protein n=1 Tax=Leptospira santarosai TaxID=28183 RepID=UPI00096007DC|nr:hypothetical protein [Leptospira santarosai]OLY62403.1 hypothetical protein BWD11_20280 [Leptospira santarosai serovar Grippotyphosa]ONF75778.1 hypothetical protein BWD12_20140 [Leptospira santarosai serovar Bananal]
MMQYLKYLISFFGGLAVAFFLSFLIETLNSEPHEGALLFNAFGWYSCVFLGGVLFGFITKRSGK